MHDKSHVVVIVPTYNEQNSIENTIHALETLFATIQSHTMSILVFDSASTDNTQQKVKHLQQQYPNIYLATEPQKTGLGSAYVQAMKFAMQSLQADIVFQFDADGSHQPKYIPEMLQLLDQGSDAVIGCRYIKGGSIPSDWAYYRQFLSKVGNQVARLVLSRKYHDYTSGLRGIKVNALKRLNLDTLLSNGYAHFLNFLWLLHKTGAKIAEFPIAFIDRQADLSKFPISNILESLKTIFLLRLFEVKRYISVGCVGAFSAVVQFTIFNILRHFLQPGISDAFAVECAIISNFILNNHFSFKDKKFKRATGIQFLLKKFGKFNLFSLCSLVLQAGIVLVGSQFLGRGAAEENTLVLLGIIIGSMWNYFAYSRLIWK